MNYIKTRLYVNKENSIVFLPTELEFNSVTREQFAKRMKLFGYNNNLYISIHLKSQKIVNMAGHSMDFDIETKKYVNAKDKKLKDRIYNYGIKPYLIQLIDNVVEIYGFKVKGKTDMALKQECLDCTYDRLKNNYNYNHGTYSSFAYFNVIVRGWLTYTSKKANKK